MHRTGHAFAALAGALAFLSCREPEPPPASVWMASRPAEVIAGKPPEPEAAPSARATDDEPIKPETPATPATPETREARLEAAGARGRATAAESIAAGRPEFLASGRPGVGAMFYGDLLEDEMSVGIRNTGCRMSAEISAAHRANNDAVAEWIDRHFGPHALERLRDRAEALRVRYRGREEQWASERRSRLAPHRATKLSRGR